MILRRDRFGDLVRRQLDLFEEDEADLLHEAVDAERRYDEADREDAEEAYGDLQLVFEAIGDQLEELRDTYAAALEDDARRRLRAVIRPARDEALPAQLRPVAQRPRALGRRSPDSRARARTGRRRARL